MKLFKLFAFKFVFGNVIVAVVFVAVVVVVGNDERLALSINTIISLVACCRSIRFSSSKRAHFSFNFSICDFKLIISSLTAFVKCDLTRS
jgi:hypothetical protein